jgi:ATP-dependent DNA helicase RecQ
VLKLTAAGRRVLRGAVTPKLLKPALRTRRESRATHESWDGVDRSLFDALRAWRRAKAEERAVPPFVVFSDATLRDLARLRPSTTEQLPAIRGIGVKKLADYGGDLVREINDYCQQYGVAMDVDPSTVAL